MKSHRKPCYKYCVVPMCENNTKTAPDKIYFNFPKSASIRTKWCEAMRRDKVSCLSTLYCCEDHFNIKEDTENYIRYKIMALDHGQRVTLHLKKGVVPYIFECQKDYLCDVQPPERKDVMKRKRQTPVEEGLAEDAVIDAALTKAGVSVASKSGSDCSANLSEVFVADAGPSAASMSEADPLEAGPSITSVPYCSEVKLNVTDKNVKITICVPINFEELPEFHMDPIPSPGLPFDIKVEMEEVSAEATNPYDSDQECLDSLQRRLSPRKKLGVNLGSFIRYDVDTEQVIYEVSTRPPLWDSSHTLYKNQCARVTAWLEIYESLFPDYHSMEYNTQKQIGKLVQMRWKTARDAYMKYKNLQKSSGDITKKYTFSDIMTFLDKIHNTDTAPVENYSSAIQDTYNATESENKSDNNARKMRKLKLLRKKKSDVDDIQHGFHKDVFTLVKQNLKLLHNGDIAFFMSLLPVTEKFSMRQKLMFRSEVIKKAMDISKNT